MLRQEVRRAGVLLDLSRQKATGDWVIITGSGAEASRGGGGSGGRASVTMQTALEFLEAERIQFRHAGHAAARRTRTRRPPWGQLRISSAELQRVAMAAAKAAEDQKMRKGMLFQTALVASGLAAMVVVPAMSVGNVA